MGEYVGQKARVIVPLHRSVDVSDAVKAEMGSTARDALGRMMAEHGCTPSDVELVEVKPTTEVDPQLLGGLTPSEDLILWIYEAIAA